MFSFVARLYSVDLPESFKLHMYFVSQAQGYPLKLARQTIRILHVLREYVTENIDKG